jgi:hypothetical protein
LIASARAGWTGKRICVGIGDLQKAMHALSRTFLEKSSHFSYLLGTCQEP